MFSSLRKSLLTISLLAGLCTVAAFYYYTQHINKPLYFPQSKIYSISPGQSIRHLSNALYDDGVTNDPYSLQVLARTTYRDKYIKAGDYQFNQGMTSVELLQQVIKGHVVQFKVTIIEGWTFDKFVEVLSNTENLRSEAKGLSRQEILDKIGFTESHPEGWFFPDTYIFTRADSDLDILKRAYRRMKGKLAELWPLRSEKAQQFLTRPYDALILASIIERETSIDDERATISSVFYNRLEKDMRLQTDPTIIYGLGDTFDGDLTRPHLRDKNNPYNTYVYKGLTPTPISLPSKRSLEAALHPENTDYFYFVATGEGGHAFNQTYQQHKLSIKDYLRVLERKKNE